MHQTLWSFDGDSFTVENRKIACCKAVNDRADMYPLKAVDQLGMMYSGMTTRTLYRKILYDRNGVLVWQYPVADVLERSHLCFNGHEFYPFTVHYSFENFRKPVAFILN